MSQFFRQAQDPVSCATHAWGAVAAFFGGMVLLLRALWADANMAALAAAMVFAFSLMALYSASAIYHYCPGTVLSGGIKRRLRKLDHSMIYVLIAGSYTPFAMVLMPQPKGARFCLVLWCVAIAGVLGKLFWINAPRAFSTVLYLAMGWALLFVWKDFSAVGTPCLLLLAAGVGLLLKGGALVAVINEIFAEREGCTPLLLCAGICMLAGLCFPAAPSVSLEGKYIWQLHALPVTPWQALRAKLQLQLLLTAVPAAFCLLCAMTVYPFSAAELALTALVTLTYTLFYGLAALALGVRLPVMTWSSEITAIKQNACVLLVSLLSFVHPLLLCGGYLLLSGWKLGYAGYMGCFLAAELLLSGLLWCWLRKRGSARFAAL